MKPKSTILLTTAFSLLMCCSSIAQPDHADRKRQQRARAVERRKSREDRVKLAQLKSSSGITVVVQEEEEREEPEEPTPPSSSLQTLPSFDGGSTASHLREAVTYKTTFLDPCGALRLRALVESAGANRDVFLLYDKHWWSNASQRLADSIPGLTTQRQPSVVKKDKLETLGGRTSKASVPSWLTWVSKLNETRPGVYAHVWHLESDVFFSGKWSTFFDQVGQQQSLSSSSEEESADVVSHLEFVPKNKCSNCGDCAIRLGGKNWRSCFTTSKNGAGNGSSSSSSSSEEGAAVPTLPKVRWPAVRVSMRLALELLDRFRRHHIVGHHEAVLGALCLHPAFQRERQQQQEEEVVANEDERRLSSSSSPSRKPWTCSIANLQKDLVGAYILGGWGKFRKGRSHKQTLDYLLEYSTSESELKFDKLYHPVKCKADTDIGPRSLACVRSPKGKGCRDGFHPQEEVKSRATLDGST